MSQPWMNCTTDGDGGGGHEAQGPRACGWSLQVLLLTTGGGTGGHLQIQGLRYPRPLSSGPCQGLKVPSGPCRAADLAHPTLPLIHSGRSRRLHWPAQQHQCQHQCQQRLRVCLGHIPGEEEWTVYHQWW